MDDSVYLLLTFYEDGSLYKSAVKTDRGTLGEAEIKYFKEPDNMRIFRCLRPNTEKSMILVGVEEILDITA